MQQLTRFRLAKRIARSVCDILSRKAESGEGKPRGLQSGFALHLVWHRSSHLIWLREVVPCVHWYSYAPFIAKPKMRESCAQLWGDAEKRWLGGCAIMRSINLLLTSAFTLTFHNKTSSVLGSMARMHLSGKMDITRVVFTTSSRDRVDRISSVTAPRSARCCRLIASSRDHAFSESCLLYTCIYACTPCPKTSTYLYFNTLSKINYFQWFLVC